MGIRQHNRGGVERRPLVFLILSLAGVLAAAAYAVAVRGDMETTEVLASAADGEFSGDLLIDLVDDSDANALQRVGALVDHAIAPFEWPDGRLALGSALSESARLYRVSPPASELNDVIRALRGDPNVESVEREAYWTVPEPMDAPKTGAGRQEPVTDAPIGPFVPNDPYYKHQWHLDQIGMPSAWRRSQGEGVVVAIIDTGVLYRDEGKFRRAPDLDAERFVPGWDFVSGDATPDDEHGHGTHVAGTVAQTTNNGVGVAGVAPRAKIMPLRVLDARGAGRFGNIAAAIRWAADNGANIINMSLGGPLPSLAVRRAIDHAHKAGVTVIAAAGNSGRAKVGYPARHRHVIAVGAVRYDETRSFYSNYGKGLDVMAPGGDMRVDQNGDGLPDGVFQNTMLPRNPSKHDYIPYQGTSMASPHVAGLAALLYASGVKRPDAIESLLTDTAKSAGDTAHYGAGLVQADVAVAKAQTKRAAGRGILALMLAGVALSGVRSRRRRIGLTASSVALAGGLALLGAIWPFSVGDPGMAFDVLSLAGWLAGGVGETWLLWVVFSAVPLGLVALTSGVASLRTPLIALCVAAGAVLGVEALMPTTVAAFLDMWVGPVLVITSLALTGTAWLLATGDRR